MFGATIENYWISSVYSNIKLISTTIDGIVIGQEDGAVINGFTGTRISFTGSTFNNLQATLISSYRTVIQIISTTISNVVLDKNPFLIKGE